MDIDLYTLEIVPRQRLAELRAQAQRSGRVSPTRRATRSRRAGVRRALIRLGHSLAQIGAGGLTRANRRRTSRHLIAENVRIAPRSGPGATRG
jgi:hypothetical protein